MKLLALEAATEQCTVATWNAGAVCWRAAPAGTTHSRSLLRLVGEVLAESGLALSQLDAIAFGRGPGAFTGVRLVTSVVQGLAYARNLPVLPVSDLEAVAEQALTGQPANARCLVCQDARLGELYWAVYDRRGAALELAAPEAVGLPAAVRLPENAARRPVIGAGSGFAAQPALRAKFAPDLACCLPELLPHAREVVSLAARRGLGAAVAPAQALPVYLRNDVARPAVSSTGNLADTQ